VFTVPGSAAEVTRDEKLARYRHLRKTAAIYHDGALSCVAHDTMMDCARRLGVTQGRTLVLDNMEEMTLVCDLAVHTGKAGRSRAIDRYARRVGPGLAGDEAMMLRAAQAARFRIWRVERPHEALGLWVTDVILGGIKWLIDEGMEISLPVGAVCAGRLMAVDDFMMTCGVLVPVSEELLTAALDNIPNIASRDYEDLLDDPRFAIGVYRAAIETGTMETVRFVNSSELALEVEMAD
jgi:hypothetical protein